MRGLIGLAGCLLCALLSAAEYPVGSGNCVMKRYFVKPQETLPDVTVTFTAEKSGKHDLLLFCSASSGNSDSVFYAVDNARFQELHTGSPIRNEAVPLGKFTLAKGPHVLKLWSRETGFAVHKLVVEAEGVRKITGLKELYLTTPLDKAVIAPGNAPELQQAAKRLAAKFHAKIVKPENLKFPLDTHVIVLGNRMNNPFINGLYRRGFCYTDSVYPGPDGYELRSIHNVTGKGFNVILCGGSEDAGAVQAAELLLKEPVNAGFLMKIKTAGFNKPVDAYSPNRYYTIRPDGGYYGWTYITAMMALFYQTGDTEYAREFLRLAFPDRKAIRDFQKFNLENFDVPSDPLASPYHYMGHNLILLWDLIEEHPFFTDAQRLAVTNAFARQMQSKSIGHFLRVFPKGVKTGNAGSRHSQWANICLYVLGRYMDRDYPAKVWKDCIRCAEVNFAAASSDTGYIGGEGGVTAWQVSGGINPAATYFALSGGQRFNPQGAYARILKFWETQWDGSGRSAVYGSRARHAFRLAADHTRDGKWLWYADLQEPYSKTAKFGPSYHPAGMLSPRPPVEMVNTWWAVPMREAERKDFHVTAPAQNVYKGLAWRDTLDTTGDWISFNCFNEEYRTPFKLLSLTGLRLNGVPLLLGFGNYLQIYQGGATGKTIPTVGEVYHFSHAGNTAAFSGGVPAHGAGMWRRDLLLARHDKVLIADTIKARQPGIPLTAVLNFETVGAQPSGDQLQFRSRSSFRIRDLAHDAAGRFAVSGGPNCTVFHTREAGDRVNLTFNLKKPFAGSAALLLYKYGSRAEKVNVYIDGTAYALGIRHQENTDQIIGENVSLSKLDLPAGKHTLTLEVDSVAEGSATAQIGAGTFTLLAGRDNVMTITAAGAELVFRGPADSSFKRSFPADPAKPVTTFTLISEDPVKTPVYGSVLSSSAALFTGKEPVLAFCGSYAPFGTGRCVMVTPDRIAGYGITRMLDFASPAPVTVDWDLRRGVLHLAGKPGTQVQAGKLVKTIPADGRLTLTGLPPVRANMPILRTAPSARKKPVLTTAKPAETAAFARKLTFVTPAEKGFLAGSGSLLAELDRSGRIIRTVRTGAPVLCAAAFRDLAITGCADEKVIAFRNGKKVWEFTSVISDFILKSQKPYWLKKAAPGVRSLAVRDGKLYVGSMCTMEVLDAASGRLIKRHSQHWGVCSKTVFADRKDGSYCAVTQRSRPVEGVSMWTIDSKNGANTRSFDKNLPGYKHFPGWMSLYRTNVFAADFDGDGETEIMADAEGMYTWLNVYRTDGTPCYQVNLGPGGQQQRAMVTCWTVGDVTGDKRPEAVLGTALNQIFAMDGKCIPLWSADLLFRPQYLAVLDHKIYAANGRRIAVLNGTGKVEKVFFTEECTGIIPAHGRLWVLTGKGLAVLK